MVNRPSISQCLSLQRRTPREELAGTIRHIKAWIDSEELEDMRVADGTTYGADITVE